MLGSNQCGQCTNNYIALIIPYALAGIAVVAFIIASKLTVSMGAINVLTFNANIIKIYEHNFFPKRSYESSYSIHLLANLDLGIETSYFISIATVFFPGYVWFLLILIVISLR